MEQSKIEELNFIMNQIGDANAGSETFDEFRWRSKVLPKLVDNDVAGMKQAAAPFAQYEMTKLALEGKTEASRLAASQFILGQAGHGTVQKVEHSMEFSKMPADQLIAVISSKIGRLQKLNPEFDFQKLVSAQGTPNGLPPGADPNVVVIPATDSSEHEIPRETS